MLFLQIFLYHAVVLPTLEKEIGNYRVIRYRKAVVTNKKDVDRMFATELHSTVDGGGLRQGCKVRGIHRWVINGTSLMSGANFVGSLKLRSNCLYTKGRASRGHKVKSANCDQCRVYESLSHILQKCSRTWAMRNARHDSVVDLVLQLLEKHGYETAKEPVIVTRAGKRIPDIVAWKSGMQGIVLDVTVVSDDADLDYTHELKRAYYEVPEVRAWVAQKACISPPEVSFSAVAMNWRGGMSSVSSRDLKAYGIGISEQEKVSVRTVEKGYHCYVFSCKST